MVKTLKSKPCFGKYKRLGRLVIVAGLAFFWTSCHHRAVVVAPPSPTPAPPAPSKRQPSTAKKQPPPPAPVVQGEEGIASWYGHPFDGRSTSSGEIYNMRAMTAAHRTLPFGTLVRVHDLENGKSVVVRINGRGPFVAVGSLAPTSATAAAIGMTRITRVTGMIFTIKQPPLGAIYT